MSSSIPAYFYSMNKIIIDDDVVFTQSMLLKMHNNNFIVTNNPINYLNYLLNEYKPNINKTELIINKLSDSSTVHNVDINIDKIKKLMLNSNNNANNDISVLLIDYHMPEINGIEFLSKITHLPMKKILITGDNDYKVAVDAFNNGIIDAYLRKDDPNFIDKVETMIADLEWKYFTELSDPILDIPDFDYFSNKSIITTFRKFIEDNNIIAFSLINIYGDFEAIDKNNKKYHILIRKKSQLIELSRIAEEDHGSSHTIDSLKNATSIPFFNSIDPWQIPANEWDAYLQPTTGMLNEPNLVWSIIRVT